jgi:hypothetical protein
MLVVSFDLRATCSVPPQTAHSFFSTPIAWSALSAFLVVEVLALPATSRKLVQLEMAGPLVRWRMRSHHKINIKI